MRRTAVVVAPGRGTYNKAELGYLARHHANQPDLIARFDAFRREQGQEAVSELDGASRFSGPVHGRGDNASPLIYASAYLDFLAIDRERIDIVGITGNSMGWYIALASAGALDAMGGFNVVNTMGTLMQNSLIGGQLVYPFVDEDWVEISGRRREIMDLVADIDRRDGSVLALSIELGGMVIVAGNTDGLATFEKHAPVVQGRFPMRLPNHAAFHTALQEPVAAEGRARLPGTLFRQPVLTMVDGRGHIWRPRATDLGALWKYTFGHQVVRAYDFTSAIRVAARELMPDLFIVLGPGTTLGGAVAQSLIRCQWKGWTTKADFQSANSDAPRLISMGMDEQRRHVTRE